MVSSAFAQRTTDKIDRGLVAVKLSTGGVYCSWRIFGEEYYDVKYNLYRDGTKVNDEPLEVSNLKDASGAATSTYTVAPVVNGVEGEKSSAVSVWANQYLDIPLCQVYDGSYNVTSDYEPNDVSVADLDGDGVVEILLKRRCLSDADGLYAETSTRFDRFEAYKLDGTLMWYISVGPNMVSGSSVEENIVAYDWDMDGKAEVVLRGADGMKIYSADGTLIKLVGSESVNTRNTISHSANMTYTNTGSEYLIYMNGETAEPYVVMSYPLARGNASDWGDSYGHRSSKYFFGAPFLDGRKASLFLARGIYTQHKMIAYDIDPSTHSLTKKWYWECLNSGSTWFGQGYHNYGIADVDWDGRDEIVYGSMVIDDNGYGLSTTGLGHGDAQHCGDFDPYSHGQEIYACNESQPGNNFRDATTSKIYYRLTAGSDDGRAMMANVTDDYPGCIGVSARDGWMSSVTHKSLGKSGEIDQNFRIYWDGDLLEETFNYSGFETKNGYYETGNPRIYKCGKGNIFSFAGSKTCNGTKGTPSFQGDILGDWREEVILRTDDGNLRLFTTTDVTAYRNYTLWHDHQYRQAMVWEMCGYNQPPHVSYFLGKMEGITVAPPPLTMTGRTEIANGETISSASDGKQIITCETNDMEVTVADGAAPQVFFDNAPTWVQGHTNNNNITRTSYTHTLKGGAFTGTMRLTKQGDGTLVLPSVTQTYTGNTDVWAGKLQFDGKLANSRLWLNRFTSLISTGGQFDKSIQMEYESALLPGGSGTGTITTDSLIMNFGSRVEFDIPDADNNDVIIANVLKIEKKNWEYGPEYLTPRFVFNLGDNVLADDGTEKKILIAKIGAVEGSVDDIVIEGLTGCKAALAYEDGNIYVKITKYQAGTVTWTGSEDGNWDLDQTQNFMVDETGQASVFVTGDTVVFDDNATNKNVIIVGNVAPAAIIFNNTSAYTLDGDSIVGNPTIIKNGTGTVTIKNVNRIGKTEINEGKLVVSSFANTIGQDYGSVGSTSSNIYINNGASLGISATSTCGQIIRIGEGDGAIDVSSGATIQMAKSIMANGGTTLTKKGAGTLNIITGNTIKKMIIQAGSVNTVDDALPATVEFQGGTLYDSNSQNSYNSTTTNFVVPEGKKGYLYQDPRCTYTGTLTGSGTFTCYGAGVRNYLQGDWSAFTGTVIPGLSKRGSYDATFVFDNTYGLPNATLTLNSDVTVDNNGKAFSLGKVTGTGTLSGSGAYTILNEGDYTFTAGTTSGTPLIKKGAGKMSLLTLGKILGSLEINEGILSFNETSAKTLVAGSTTKITGTGHVMGKGLLQSIQMSGEGQLTPGSATTEGSVGTIKTNTLLRADKGSTINMIIARKTSAGRIVNSYLEVGSYLTVNGNLNIRMLDTYTPEKGDSICLWTCTTFKGSPSITLPELPEGLAWDTSNLLAEQGILRIVADAAGISEIGYGEEMKCSVYTIGGIFVAELKSTVSELGANLKKQGVAPGLYIVRMTANGIAKSYTVTVK